MTDATGALPASASRFKGNDSALLGIVLAVITFWLFAQTTMSIGPLVATDVGMPMPAMNIAISLAALFSGMFTVALGSLGDRYGRVRLVFIGNLLSVAADRGHSRRDHRLHEPGALGPALRVGHRSGRVHQRRAARGRTGPRRRRAGRSQPALGD